MVRDFAGHGEWSGDFQAGLDGVVGREACGRGGAREGSGVVNRGRREIWSWVARPNPAEAVSDIRGG